MPAGSARLRVPARHFDGVALSRKARKQRSIPTRSASPIDRKPPLLPGSQARGRHGSGRPCLASSTQAAERTAGPSRQLARRGTRSATNEEKWRAFAPTCAGVVPSSPACRRDLGSRTAADEITLRRGRSYDGLGRSKQTTTTRTNPVNGPRRAAILNQTTVEAVAAHARSPPTI
jgi:hypothetical protein